MPTESNGLQVVGLDAYPWLPFHAVTPTVFILHGYPHVPRQTSGAETCDNLHS